MSETKAELQAKVKVLEARCKVLTEELDSKHTIYIKLYAVHNEAMDKLNKMQAVIRGDK